MSFIPKWITEFNFIKRFFIDPCDAPVTAYVETFFPAALKAIITYYTPDLKNIIVSYLRPARAMMQSKGRRKGGGGKKSGRGPKGSLIRGALNFDTSNEMGKRLPGAQQVRGRQVSAGIVSLWLFEGVLERVLFWFFVMDIIGEFFFNWASLLEETIFCQSRGATLLVVTKPTQSAIGAMGWIGVTMNEILKQRGNVHWGVASAGFTGHIATVIWTGTAVNTWHEPVDIGLRFRVVDNEGTRFVNAVTVRLPINGEGQITTTIEVKGPAIVAPDFRVFLGTGRIDNMVFYLHGDIEA